MKTPEGAKTCHKQPSIVSTLRVTWHEKNSSGAYRSETFPAAWPGPLNEEQLFLCFKTFFFYCGLSLIFHQHLIPSIHDFVGQKSFPAPLVLPLSLSGHVLLAEKPWLALYLAPSCTWPIGSILWFLILKFVCLSHHLALPSKRSLSIACRVFFQTEMFVSGLPCFSLSFLYGVFLHYFALMKTYPNILSFSLETECAGPWCSHVLVI